MARRRYTDEELVFLRDGYLEMGIPALTNAFNKRFGLNKTSDQIKSTLSGHGFTCGRTTGELSKGRLKLMSDEQADWVRDQYKKLSREDMTNAFNEKFGTDLSEQQITAFCKNHGIKSGRTGYFGTRPSWNKGTKGLVKANTGSFAPGSVPPNRKPMYTERVNTDGYVEIKVPIPNKHTGHDTSFMLKNRWLYQEAYGPIPEGHNVIFKDGDRTNFDLDNLVCVSQRQLSLLNVRKYFDAHPELKEVIWRVVDLECGILAKTLKDGDKAMRQLVAEAIDKPRTAAEISEITGVNVTQTHTLLHHLRKDGKAKVVGTKFNGRREVNLWVSDTCEYQEAV